MTAPAPRDEHRPLSDGATALAPQPAPRPARETPTRRASPRRGGDAVTAPATPAAPVERPAPRPGARGPRARVAAPAPSVTPRRSRPAVLPVGLAAKLPRAKAHRAPFVVLLLVLMGGGLLCLLLLNTALSENAFQTQALQATASGLADQGQALDLQADQLSAPASLAARAAVLGMAQGALPIYLPSDAPVPSGARRVAASESGGMVLYVVPAPAKPAAAASPAGQGATGSAPSAHPSAAPSAGGTTGR